MMEALIFALLSLAFALAVNVRITRSGKRMHNRLEKIEGTIDETMLLPSIP